MKTITMTSWVKLVILCRLCDSTVSSLHSFSTSSTPLSPVLSKITFRSFLSLARLFWNHIFTLISASCNFFDKTITSSLLRYGVSLNFCSKTDNWWPVNGILGCLPSCRFWRPSFLCCPKKIYVYEYWTKNSRMKIKKTKGYRWNYHAQITKNKWKIRKAWYNYTKFEPASLEDQKKLFKIISYTALSVFVLKNKCYFSM